LLRVFFPSLQLFGPWNLRFERARKPILIPRSPLRACSPVSSPSRSSVAFSPHLRLFLAPPFQKKPLAEGNTVSQPQNNVLGGSSASHALPSSFFFWFLHAPKVRLFPRRFSPPSKEGALSEVPQRCFNGFLFTFPLDLFHDVRLSSFLPLPPPLGV